MQFHLFVAAFYAVDRPFAFEIERVAVGARQAESRSRVAQAQFVLSAADRQDVERLPAGRHRRQVRELHPLAAFRFGFSGRRQAGARRTVRQVSERPRLSGRGRDSPAARSRRRSAVPPECRSRVGHPARRVVPARGSATPRRPRQPRRPQAADRSSSAISRFGGFGIVRLLRLLGHGFLGDREPQRRRGGLVTGVEGCDRPFVTARFEP